MPRFCAVHVRPPSSVRQTTENIEWVTQPWRDDAGDSQTATAEGAPEPHASIIRAGPDTLGEAARICPLFAVAGRWNNLKVALR